MEGGTFGVDGFRVDPDQLETAHASLTGVTSQLHSQVALGSSAFHGAAQAAGQAVLAGELHASAEAVGAALKAAAGEVEALGLGLTATALSYRLADADSQVGV
jgi:hypothetical protein